MDELFRAEILHGYSTADPLKVDRITANSGWADNVIKQLYVQGILTVYPDVEFGGSPFPMSNYMQAVAAHAAALTLVRAFEDERLIAADSDARRSRVQRLTRLASDVARLTSMRQDELRRLGGDPEQILRDLTRARDKAVGAIRFAGR